MSGQMSLYVESTSSFPIYHLRELCIDDVHGSRANWDYAIGFELPENDQMRCTKIGKRCDSWQARNNALASTRAEGSRPR